MPAPDLEAFKVAAGELSSATKFNNALQAIEDEFSDIDPDQISGYPSDATKFLRGDGTWPALGVWTAYTPTWSGTIGNGTLSGKYTQIGKTVIGYLRVVWGSTTSHGTGVQIVGLPVAAALAQQLSFFAQFNDASAGEFKGFTRFNSTSDVVLLTGGEATVNSIVNNTTPFTWTTSDEVRINFTYEAA